MARCLIIGCGCRGMALAGALIGRGHAVRGTTRDPARREMIEGCGAEAAIGDPDRVGTLAPALEHVTVACLLLGSARGSSEALRALHGPRLQMLLSRMLDSTVHAIVYEAGGPVDAAVLASGEQIVREFCDDSRVPYAVLRCDPSTYDSWLAEASKSVLDLLEPSC